MSCCGDPSDCQCVYDVLDADGETVGRLVLERDVVVVDAGSSVAPDQSPNRLNTSDSATMPA